MKEASCLKICGSVIQEGTANAKEIRQAERLLWLMHMMEKNVGLRISTNCKCTAHVLPQDFKWKSSLNMSKLGNRTTLCQLCWPPADGNSSSISGVISLQEFVNLGTILQSQACCRTEAPLCAGVLQNPKQSAPETSEPIWPHTGIWMGSNGTKRRLQTQARCRIWEFRIKGKYTQGAVIRQQKPNQQHISRVW